MCLFQATASRGLFFPHGCSGVGTTAGRDAMTHSSWKASLNSLGLCLRVGQTLCRTREPRQAWADMIAHAMVTAMAPADAQLKSLQTASQ